MDGFEILSKLGEGAYSTVYKVKRMADNNIYALKKVRLLKLSKKEKENALNEVRLLASVNSNFVISYKEAFFDEKDSCLGIVMEYADKGDLYQKITSFRKKGVLFDEIDIWRVIIQLVKGLKALHELKVLHRDLKSANVFIFSDGSVKLGDLNVSKVAKKGLGYTQTGTPYYASPEVWDDRPYNNKSDIWSLGCVIYEMITLRPPFRAENMEGLYHRVCKGQYNRISEKYSNDLAYIIKQLIQVDPNKRPSCEEILKMSVIQKRIEYFKSFSGEDATEDQALLKTINIPKNLIFLSDKLPQPHYETKNKHNYNSFTSQKDKIVSITALDSKTSNLTMPKAQKLPDIRIRGVRPGDTGNTNNTGGTNSLMNNNCTNSKETIGKDVGENNTNNIVTNSVNSGQTNANNGTNNKETKEESPILIKNNNNNETSEKALENKDKNISIGIPRSVKENAGIIDIKRIERKKDNLLPPPGPSGQDLRKNHVGDANTIDLEKGLNNIGSERNLEIHPIPHRKIINNSPNNNINRSVKEINSECLNKIIGNIGMQGRIDSIENNPIKLPVKRNNHSLNSIQKELILFNSGDPQTKKRIFLPEIKKSVDMPEINKLSQLPQIKYIYNNNNRYVNFKNKNEKMKIGNLYKVYAPNIQKPSPLKYQKFYLNRKNELSPINLSNNGNPYYIKSLESQNSINNIILNKYYKISNKIPMELNGVGNKRKNSIHQSIQKLSPVKSNILNMYN